MLLLYKHALFPDERLLLFYGNLNKSTSMRNMSYYVIVSLSLPLYRHLSHVFNSCVMLSTILQQNCFPNGYKINFLTPLPLFTVMISEYAVTPPSNSTFFSSPYSNGRLKGQINRLKTIKRIMYGRAGLKLLEKWILYRL